MIRAAFKSNTSKQFFGLQRCSLHSKQEMWLCQEHASTEARVQLENDIIEEQDIHIIEVKSDEPIEKCEIFILLNECI